MSFFGYIWVGLGLVLLVVELVKAYEFTLWLAIGAFIVSGVAFAGASLAVQVIAAVVLCPILCVLSRKLSFLSLRPLREKQTLRVKPDELIGRRAVVLIGIHDKNGNGLVSLDGQKWVARSFDGSKITQGSQVEVISIMGLKVLVKPI